MALIVGSEDGGAAFLARSDRSEGCHALTSSMCSTSAIGAGDPELGLQT
jgi:hypothetical protein